MVLWWCTPLSLFLFHYNCHVFSFSCISMSQCVCLHPVHPSLSLPCLSVSLSAFLSISFCLSNSSYLPSPNLYIPCDRANPLIIYELLRLSWQWWQIPTGFNHGHTNEISMANAHGSPSFLTSLPLSNRRSMWQECTQDVWVDCRVAKLGKPPGSNQASPQGAIA